VQPVGRALSCTSSGKDEPLIVFQNLDPRLPISGMVRSALGKNTKRRTKECRTQSSEQFFGRVGSITEPVAFLKITIQSALVAGLVH
jgi:hypothetical protein